MRFIKNIMSRKPDPEELSGAFEMDVEPLQSERMRRPEADDSGQLNAAGAEEKLAEAKRLFGLEDDGSSELADPAPDPAPAWNASGDDWDDADWDDDDDWDEDWSEDEDDVAVDDREDISAASDDDSSHLVEEIREAVGAMGHIAPEEKRIVSAPRAQIPGEKDWAMDEDFGRKAIARKELGLAADESEARLLEETNWKLGDDETARRRSAMAHLKAAAKATKADRVLSSTVGRDLTADPEEQSPYRADLAKVVRPRPTSRPTPSVSRPSPLATQAAQDLQETEDNAWIGGSAPDFPIEPTHTAAEPASNDNDTEWADDVAETAAFAGDMPEGDVSGEAEDDLPPARRQSRKIWDLGEADIAGDAAVADATAPETNAMASEPLATTVVPAVEPAAPNSDADTEAGFQVPQPAAGRAGRRGAGRVKTRLLGFQGGDQARDVFAQPQTAAAEAPEEAEAPAGPAMFPAGWIVVLEGPGRGASFTLFTGVSQIGRGEDQAIRLDFGDTAVSRQNHAAVAYDHEQRKFFLGHGGKSNLVRLNDRPVLSTEELSDGDRIRIGETTLRFIALCGEAFSWDAEEGDGAAHAILP